MVSGKSIRLNRITFDGKMLCIPMDHGVTIGPVKGLDEIFKTIDSIQKGGASAVLLHKGIIKSLPKTLKIGIIMHFSASTIFSLSPNRKMVVASVEEALRLGVDAVSIHVNIGCDEEHEMISSLGELADECDKWDIPLIAMMYPRGQRIKNEFDPEIVAHVARIGAELGADIVKTVYTGSSESFRKVVNSCPVPIVIAGGPKVENDKQVLEMAKGAMDAGAIGVTFGRNVFQHENPKAIVKALASIVFRKNNIEEALEVLNKEWKKE